MRGAESCETTIEPDADGAAAVVAARLGDLGAALAALRSRLAAGDPPDRAVIERLLGVALPELPGVGRNSAVAGCRLAVLDEISGLLAQLEHERGQLLAQMSGSRRARRAEASCRAGGRLP